MANRVTTIRATRTIQTGEVINSIRKRKVAAYARVSTDHEDQLSSYEAQVDYYSNFIKTRDDWTFVKVYADEGISGTSTKHREGFKEMINDALAGKIDLIILTKSVSRFARNTVDCLNAIRKLKDNGVEVHFEKENIYTFDSKGELLLTIMGSLAQEESRSISENCKWGQRKRFADGKATVPFSRFLGFDRGEHGEFIVNEKEAEVVRYIYKSIIDGLSAAKVAKLLTERGIKTPGGCDKWASGTVRAIVRNEKYKGDALLQKGFTVDFLTKKTKKNEGELDQYYVKHHHEAIVSEEAYELANSILDKRSNVRISTSGLFASKVKCKCCGSYYGKKVWHSNTPNRKEVYRCNSMFDGDKCDSPIFTEEELKNIVLKAINQLASIKEKVKKTFEVISAEIDNTQPLEDSIVELDSKLQEAVNNQTIHFNNLKTSKQKIDEWHKKNDELTAEVDRLKKEKADAELKLKSIKASKQKLVKFIEMVNGLEEIKTFDEDLMNSLVEELVASKESVDVIMKNGQTINVKL